MNREQHYLAAITATVYLLLLDRLGVKRVPHNKAVIAELMTE